MKQYDLNVHLEEIEDEFGIKSWAINERAAEWYQSRLAS